MRHRKLAQRGGLHLFHLLAQTAQRNRTLYARECQVRREFAIFLLDSEWLQAFFGVANEVRATEAGRALQPKALAATARSETIRDLSARSGNGSRGATEESA